MPSVQSVANALRKYALSFPETSEDHPWGEVAIKVKGKVFLFLHMPKGKPEFSFSVKLPQSRDIAIDLPFTHPTHYGLGKHGWVSAEVNAKNASIDLFKAWIGESYRAVAPKTLVKQMHG